MIGVAFSQSIVCLDLLAFCKLLKVVLEKKDGMWFGVRFYGAYGRKGMVVFSIIQLFEEKQVIGDI